MSADINNTFILQKVENHSDESSSPVGNMAEELAPYIFNNTLTAISFFVNWIEMAH